MATITLAELRQTGAELFQDSESFLNDLNDMDSISVHGGDGASYGASADLEKFLEFGLIAYGLHYVTYLVKSFSKSDGGHDYSKH